MSIPSRVRIAAASLFALIAVAAVAPAAGAETAFEIRPGFAPTTPNSVPEILDVTPNGNLLISTNNDFEGEDNGRYVLVGFQSLSTAGDEIRVYDLQTPASPVLAATIAVGDGVDSVAVSPNRQRGAAAIENEADPLTPGRIEALDLSNADPTLWTATPIAIPTLDPGIYDEADDSTS